MNVQPTGYDIDSSGTISMPLTTTSAIADNSSNDGADIAFSGEINSSDGSSVEFVWVFDATDNAPDVNNAPSVGDVTVNAVVGDLISETVTATDPDGDTVTLSFNGFNGPLGAVGNSTFLDNGDDTGLFTWDSTGFAPGTYIALIQGTDGFVTDVGQVTVNLRMGAQQVPPVPLPASVFFVMAGMAALGGLGMRRRKR